jgi:hypothetical protein
MDDIYRLMNRALLTAHLLTGSVERAEEAAVEAINLWNPDEESQETLFNRVVEAAARTKTPSNPRGSDPSGSNLPDELKTVLGLEIRPRHCFVLRILLRLPSSVCARLLGLRGDQVDEFTHAALQCLAAS